jgi:hypothetical protein
MFFRYIVIIIFLSFISTNLYAQINVIAVKGQVAYKKGRVWAPLQRGARLFPGVKISTGYRSSATIMLNRHRVILKQLTMIKVYENSVKKLQQRTRIGLRRGTIRAKVNKARKIKTLFRVSTPVATSSVRGTEKEISFGPAGGMTINMIEGEAEGESKNGTKKLISGQYVFNQKFENKDPQPLLYRVEMQTAVPLYNDDGSTTSDERRSNRFSRFEVIGSESGTAGIINSIDTKTVTVQITISFP